mgnify:CR=1 FL=1
MSNQEKEELQITFQALDKDNDGILDREELDGRGSTETQVALNILEAVVKRLDKGAH